MGFAFPLSKIRRILGDEAVYEGTYEGEVRGIASLGEAEEGDLSFLGNLRYRREVAGSRASVLLLPVGFELEPRAGQLLIRIPNPSFSLALVCREIERELFPLPPPGVHPSAIIEAGAEIHPKASIGAFCYVAAGAAVGNCVLHQNVYVGRQARVGDGSVLFQRVVVGDFCRIGCRNRIHAGVVMGADGYGYEYLEGAHQHLPQVGIVETDDDVDIGANTTIDRARFGATSIGQGTKVDNLVQIAHNVRIGRHCLIVAQVGISGSTVLEDGVVVGGQAGLAGHLRIGAGAQIAAQSGVASSLDAGVKVRGYPAEPMLLYNRICVLQRRLPELFKRFDLLEKKLESAGSEEAAKNKPS